MDLYNKFVKKLDEIDLKGNYKSNEDCQLLSDL